MLSVKQALLFTEKHQWGIPRSVRVLQDMEARVVRDNFCPVELALKGHHGNDKYFMVNPYV